jgi:hypothetical protein
VLFDKIENPFAKFKTFELIFIGRMKRKNLEMSTDHFSSGKIFINFETNVCIETPIKKFGSIFKLS